MKISWGIKIIISFVIFAAGIITMVAISFSKKTDLVSENYYEQEIKYQDQIDILKNSKELEKNINLTNVNNFVIVNSINTESLQGELYFYRTSNAAKDFKVDFKPDNSGVQSIQTNDLEKGLWKVKITLTDGTNKFFVEKSIYIN